MAILKMSKFSIYGLISDRKAILETLHKKEIAEICEPNAEYTLDFVETAKSIAQFEKYMQSAEAALAVLNEYAPKKSGLIKTKRKLSLSDYHMAKADSGEATHYIHHIIKLSDKIRSNTESIGNIIAKQEALAPYLALDIPMQERETAYTFVKTGTLSGLWTAERLQKELENNQLFTTYFEILNASKERSHIWLVFPTEQEAQANEFLQSIGFTEPTFSLSHHQPAKKIEVLEDAKVSLKKGIDECIAEIKDCGKYRDDIELFYDHLLLRKDKYQVLSRAGMTQYTFVIEGYIPQKYSDELKKELEDSFGAYTEITQPDDDEDTPVAFENNAFVAPVESITETYSMPSKTDIDPNPIMAFFYYLFFGMMFSDAGYGLIMAIICGYLGFGKRLDKQQKKSFQMFFYCGVSTVFWGLLFGGFFGNIIYTISTSFMGRTIELKPIWLDPISQAMELLIYSVALGLVQILIGMSIKFYMLIRQKEYMDAICDVGFWIVTLLGICGMAIGMTLGITVVGDIGKWTAIVSAAGLLLTGGRKSKSIIGKIIGGVTGLYSITGYVSDALSYCRLMALGLATGAIANVANMLGTMFGSGVVGVILFVVVALFAHTLNFAMNALGAYVHTNRLQFVEFFSKFYDGGGKKFEPLRMNTKYCNFSQEKIERK